MFKKIVGPRAGTKSSVRIGVICSTLAELVVGFKEELGRGAGIFPHILE